MKTKRQNLILDIVENEQIETQEELIDKLRRRGLEVTQATISRDIREMKLAKVMCETGSYKYIVPKTTTNDGHHVYNRALTASIKMVDHAMNIVVVHTYPGMANAVAAGIDVIRTEEILGSVAGDDTIIVVTKDVDCAVSVEKRLKKIIE